MELFSRASFSTQSTPSVSSRILTLKGTDKTIFTDQIIVTNDKGRFEFTPLSSGTYIVVVECEGYETQTIKDVIINTGATTRLNVQMVAVAA